MKRGHHLTRTVLEEWEGDSLAIMGLRGNGKGESESSKNARLLRSFASEKWDDGWWRKWVKENVLKMGQTEVCVHADVHDLVGSKN